MDRKIALELDYHDLDPRFLSDLLEVNAMRLKNHISQLKIWLRENERAISDTKAVKNSNRWIILYSPDQKILELEKEREKLENQLDYTTDGLEMVRSMFTQIQTQIHASINRPFDKKLYRKVFNEPGDYPAVWHGYQSYHYQNI
jgi:hypothetical protein